ncbi:hypothetical protein [Williamsia sp.]|uniref:hypothetical protein n=1 Tax=Williamsia sp. TaxID=1872085 RepID=UPI001A1B4A2B|nr:hypothetical protein [Williamsia sp.]MBJ7287562.1 hypothetical protein [Williamsia sp.]
MKLGGKKTTTPDDEGGGYRIPDLPESLDADERSWMMRSPITLWLSVIVLLAAVVGAVVVVAFGGSNDSAKSFAPEVSAPPPASTTVSPSGSSPAGEFGAPSIDYNNRRVDVPINVYGQPLEQSSRSSSSAFDAALPLPVPTGMKWEYFFGLALPYSTSDGPTILDGPLVSGFAHTPQGAALAGYQIFGRQLQGSQDARRAVAQGQTLAGDDAAHKRYIDEAITPGAPAVKPRLLLRPDAFRVISYAPDFAVTQYAVPIGFGGQDAVTSWGVVQEQLVWSGGNWTLKIGDPDPQLPQTNSLLGWTTW